MIMRITLAMALAMISTKPLLADIYHPDDVIIAKGGSAGLCVGVSCVDGEPFDITFGGEIKVKSATTRMLFEDTTTAAGFPAADWSLQANETTQTGAAGEAFLVKNATANTTPLRIQGSAPTNTLYLGQDGKVGMGTSLPVGSLHIYDPIPTISLDATSGTDIRWDIAADTTDISISNETHSDIFKIYTEAPNDSLAIRAGGDVGFGIASPDGKLHTFGTGVQLAYFESGDGDAVQVRFRTDSENRRFLAVDNADNVKTQMQFRDNAILFLGETVAQEWLNVSAAGITTAGPTCNPGPCDATFDPDQFEVPPLKERTAYMWENQHLWAVGPTKPGEPINLTQKTGAILHELEVAYIYIEQLHDRLETQEARLLAIESTIGKN